MNTDSYGDALDMACKRITEQSKQIEALTAQVGVLREALSKSVSHGTSNICTHEETHRGGAIWEICDACGAMWADDNGGKPEFNWPQWVLDAEAALASTPESALSEVRRDERERCAKVCEEQYPYTVFHTDLLAAKNCAEAIRAME